ncbi:MAG TPA: polyprenyl synthetase family protein [Herpetosiphonaceae bacterium]
MNQLVAAIDLAQDLQAIDRAVLEKFESRSALLNVASRYLLSSGGKRVRAALTLLCARLGAHYDERRVYNVATAIEMIHSASLVHDDLVDEAEVRRGRVTVHSKWGGNVALMVGDYLFALAAGQMAEASDPRIIKSFARGVERICEAELSPVTDVEPLQKALDQYYAKIGGKTAALFECAAEGGLLATGGTEQQIEALRHFGYEIGLAFQIVDDVLDFTADEQTLGKPAGHDLKEGTITLPVLYAIDQGASEIVREAALTYQPSNELVAAAVAEVRRVCATKRAFADAEKLIEKAIRRLDIFPDSPARDGLIDLAELVLRRKM